MIFFKLFMFIQISIFRLTNGRLMASMRGMPVLLINTIGRKSAKKYITSLMYFKDGENYIITASNNGRNRHPGWFYNLKEIPHVSKEVPGRQLQVNAFIADDKDREKYWSILVSRAPFFENYRRGTTRNIPVVVLKPA